MGWAYSTKPVTTPTNPQSLMQQHDDAELYAFNRPGGITTDALYGQYITGKVTTTTTTGKPTSTTTTSTKSTTTTAAPTVSAKPYE